MSLTQQVIAIILGGCSIAAVALGVLRWIIRNEVRDIKHETTSNGGQSMNDFIKLQIFPLVQELRDEQRCMREDQLEIKGIVSSLEGWKQEHIRDHA